VRENEEGGGENNDRVSERENSDIYTYKCIYERENVCVLYLHEIYVPNRTFLQVEVVTTGFQSVDCQWVHVIYYVLL
jgi:hypothetical protein